MQRSAIERLSRAARLLFVVLCGVVASSAVTYAAQPALIAAGGEHTCAIVTNEGGVVCWGSDYFGTPTLGSASPLKSAAPLAVPGLSGVVGIAAGAAHSCALVNTGAIKCWGYNRYGQLGSGNNTDSVGPTDVVGLAAGPSKWSLAKARPAPYWLTVPCSAGAETTRASSVSARQIAI